MTRANAMLVTGYILAVPPLLRFRAIVKDRNVMSLAVLEVGQILIAAGWAVKRKPARTLVNVAAAAAYPAWWVMRGDRD